MSLAGNETEAVNPSDLCVTCGLCCDGTLFNWAPVADDEFERVVFLGLKKPDEENRDSFSLPCPQLDGTKCACYTERRPAICGDFMCTLVDTLEAGELSLAETQEVVAKTRRLSADVRARLVEITGGGPTLSIHELSVLLDAEMKRSGDERAFRRQHGALYLGLASLHLALSAHFFDETGDGGRELWSAPGTESVPPS